MLTGFAGYTEDGVMAHDLRASVRLAPNPIRYQTVSSATPALQENARPSRPCCRGLCICPCGTGARGARIYARSFCFSRSCFRNRHAPPLFCPCCPAHSWRRSIARLSGEAFPAHFVCFFFVFFILFFVLGLRRASPPRRRTWRHFASNLGPWRSPPIFAAFGAATVLGNRRHIRDAV